MAEHSELNWTKPIMRAGYSGRALVYLVVAGISLFALWQGGQAEGTSSAMERIEGSAWGKVVLVLIFLGMFSYAVWRLIDSYFDLEDYGTDGKGIIARIGMVTTGIIHAVLGFVAFTLVFTGGSGGSGGGASGGGGGGGSSLTSAIDTIMGWPGGRWIVGIAGLVTIGAGIYYIHKGWKEKYLESLRANSITANWNWVLKAGLIAQGVIVAIIGGLFAYAAWTFDPDQAGGIDKAFGWLTAQPYGRVLTAAICVGLLGFAVFCAVNAAYRIIPKLAGDDVETLGARLKAKAENAVGT